MLGRLAKGGLKKEHEAELEDSDADTRALGVLGTGTGEQTCLLAPAAQWHLRGCLAGALRASTLAVKSRRAVLCASVLPLGGSCPTPRAGPSLFPAERYRVLQGGAWGMDPQRNSEDASCGRPARSMQTAETAAH